MDAFLRRLEDLYEEFNRREMTASDPLALLDRAMTPRDLEVTSFLVAGLSYGRVAQIQRSAELLWQRLRSVGLEHNGESISGWLRETPACEVRTEAARALASWKHRLNTSSDLAAILSRLSSLLKKESSLAAVFQLGWDPDAQVQIERFCALIAGTDRFPAKGTPWAGTGLTWFAASPALGGSAKRLLMWLRWMARKDEVDLGLWREPDLLRAHLPIPDASRLFSPIDTHIFQWGREAKILHLKSVNWRAVLTLTKFFRELRPADPARYDFALCQAGMRGSPRPMPPHLKLKKRGQAHRVDL